MLDSDSKYIDEYKRVDKICSDMLGDPCGITAYIELMKKAVISGEDLPGSWSTAIKTLVHLRHIRNSIAHDTSPVSCTKNDLNSLKAFGLFKYTDCKSLLFIVLNKYVSRGCTWSCLIR